MFCLSLAFTQDGRSVWFITKSLCSFKGEWRPCLARLLAFYTVAYWMHSLQNSISNYRKLPNFTLLNQEHHWICAHFGQLNKTMNPEVFIHIPTVLKFQFKITCFYNDLNCCVTHSLFIEWIRAEMHKIQSHTKHSEIHDSMWNCTNYISNCNWCH